MNASFFEINWAPNRFFDSDEDSAASYELFTDNDNQLAAKLEVAYLERVSRYEQEIKQGYERIRWGASPRAKRYPSVKVDLPGGTETVAFDDELDARLMEIYVLHGWDGILKLEESLLSAQEKRETKFTEPWFVVVPFYFFTRNRLVLLIRQALIEIEKKAAQAIIIRLNMTSIEVIKAWDTKFMFSSKKVRTGRWTNKASLDTPEPEMLTVHSITNRELSDALFLLLSEAIKAAAFLNEQNKKRERLDRLIEEAEHEFGRGKAPGTGGTYMELEDTKKLVMQTTNSLNTLHEQIFRTAPLALLALPLLKPGFEQPEMENIIGETLWPFYGKLDQLSQAINSETSLVAVNFPGIQQDSPDATRKLESSFLPGYNIEALCAEKAISEAVDNPAFLVLLSDQTLNRLIETKAIEAGTLTYIVCQRYTVVLLHQIEATRKKEEKLKAFFEVLAKFGAAFSLAALLSAPNPVLSGGLRGASVILGVPAFLFATYSVIRQLSIFDHAVNLRLAEFGPTNIKALSETAELVAVRAEYVQQITQTLIAEIGLMTLDKVAILKQTLHLRSIYADLQSLLEG